MLAGSSRLAGERDRLAVGLLNHNVGHLARVVAKFEWVKAEGERQYGKWHSFRDKVVVRVGSGGEPDLPYRCHSMLAVELMGGLTGVVGLN